MFSTVTSESLQKKSVNILSVFTKTIDDLRSVNEKANAQASNNREEAAKLILEADTLNRIELDNAKVIEKIKQILN